MGADSVPAAEACENLGEGSRTTENEIGGRLGGSVG